MNDYVDINELLENSKCMIYLGTSWSGAKKDSDGEEFYDYYYSYDYNQIIYFHRSCLDPKSPLKNEIDLSNCSWQLNFFENPIELVPIVKRLIDEYFDSIRNYYGIESAEDIREVILSQKEDAKSSLSKSFDLSLQESKPLKKERKFNLFKKKSNK